MVFHSKLAGYSYTFIYTENNKKILFLSQNSHYIPHNISPSYICDNWEGYLSDTLVKTRIQSIALLRLNLPERARWRIYADVVQKKLPLKLNPSNDSYNPVGWLMPNVVS